MAKAKNIQTDLARRLGVTQRELTQKLKAFAETVGEQLTEGKQVALLGIGVIETRRREPRETVNPTTKERMTIAGKTVPAFRVSGNFKEKIKAQDHE